MFPFGRRIPVIVLNELKLFPRSRDDGAIINTPLKKKDTNFYPKEFIGGYAQRDHMWER